MRIARRRVLTRLSLASLLAGAMLLANIAGKPGEARHEIWREGDILFLNGNSVRSKLVRLLEGYSTDYSHVGMVIVENGTPFVIHADPAAGKVIKQRWDQIICSGDYAGGAIYRLCPPGDLPPREAGSVAREFARDGIPFNYNFDLNAPDRLFCTELVWCAYRVAGVDLCQNARTDHPHLLPADILKSPRLQQVLRF